MVEHGGIPAERLKACLQKIPPSPTDFPWTMCKMKKVGEIVSKVNVNGELLYGMEHGEGGRASWARMPSHENASKALCDLTIYDM